MGRCKGWLAGSALLFAAGGVAASGVPAAFVGTWTDDAACRPLARSLSFAAGTMALRQDDGRRALLAVEATGKPAEREVFRVTKVLQTDDPADPFLPRPGDALIVRVGPEGLQLLGRTEAGQTEERPGGPILHRCPR